MVGQTIAHYRIVSQLGSVEWAWCMPPKTSVSAAVALKFVPEELAGIVRPSIASEARPARPRPEPREHLHHLRHRRARRPALHRHGAVEAADASRSPDQRPLRVHETLDIGIQVADALDSAHARTSFIAISSPRISS